MRASATDPSADVQSDRSGSQREVVGFPVADFQIKGTSGPRCHRQPEADDQLAGQQNRFDMRCIAWQNVKLLERDEAPARRPDDFDHGIERDKRLREVAWIGGDAMITDPEHGVLAVDPVERGAAGPGLALVARPPGRIAKI
jgi:hypothetical protein